MVDFYGKCSYKYTSQMDPMGILYKLDTLRPMRSPDLESYDLGIGKGSPDSHKWIYEQQKGTRKINENYYVCCTSFQKLQDYILGVQTFFKSYTLHVPFRFVWIVL